MLLWRPALAAVFATLLLALPAHATPACDVPAEYAAEARPLPQAARALAAGHLSVLAIGSGSAAGAAGSQPEAAWPARLAATLQARFPQARVEMSVRGARGVTAMEHLAMLRDGPSGAALVVWQVGTVEAARGLDADEMSDALRSGIERLRRGGADIVLMDQQFSRFLRANANVEPYRDKLRLVATATGTPLLRRYDLMQGWAEGGGPDVERAPRNERTAVMDRLNDCVGRALGALVIRGIAMSR